MKHVISIILILLIMFSVGQAQPDLELCNNWLMNLSFVTGTDRGMAQNLDDNLDWMAQQGYTHLRFFGIFTNGVHCFPSPTLDANGYPSNSYFEPVLELLVTKAALHGIVVNFDGWEIIAESNYDTTNLGVGFIDDQEMGLIVQEVLSLGVILISEEQFGSGHLQAIQSATSQAGAIHETTAGLWWHSAQASSIADEQLSSVFSFYPHDQIEYDNMPPSAISGNLGMNHLFMEGPEYFGVPYSLAVGSFGTLNTENWANVLRFVQMQHNPKRFSIEETNWNFLVWDSSYDFKSHIGDELLSMENENMVDRPVANLVFDLSVIGSTSFVPTWYSSIISSSAIVNTFTSLGYRVVPTLDSVLPDAELYYLLLAGGSDSQYVSSLPEYVMPLLQGAAPVFVQPTFGLPDENDAVDWIPFREFFDLPSGDTYTLADSIPVGVTYDGSYVLWRGVSVYLTPRMEIFPSDHFDTTESAVLLSADVLHSDAALLVGKGNKFLINCGVVHLEASYIFSDLLGGPLNAPSSANIVIVSDRALAYAEYDTEVDFQLPWPGLTSVSYFDPAGNLTQQEEINLEGLFARTMLRGELAILRRVTTSCCLGIRGDVNSDGDLNVTDLTYQVDYLFRGGPAPPCMDEADVNGSGGTDVADLTYLVEYLFQAGPEPLNCI